MKNPTLISSRLFAKKLTCTELHADELDIIKATTNSCVEPLIMGRTAKSNPVWGQYFSMKTIAIIVRNEIHKATPSEFLKSVVNVTL